MQNHPHYNDMLARQHHEMLLEEARAERLARSVRTPDLALARRAARMAGRALVRLGAQLAHYGQDTELSVLTLPRRNTRSAQLN